MECRRLSNSGKRKRKKKRKSVNVITRKSLVEGEKENRKMIIEIALLVINEFTLEYEPSNIKASDCSGYLEKELLN